MTESESIKIIDEEIAFQRRHLKKNLKELKENIDYVNENYDELNAYEIYTSYHNSHWLTRLFGERVSEISALECVKERIIARRRIE